MSGSAEQQYPPQPHARKHSPRRRYDYLWYRPCLRLEFGYRCVYCLATETEVGPSSPWGSFEVEHYRPVSRFGSLESVYKNLYWSCHQCNLAKGDEWPTTEEQRAGFRFLDPCSDAPADHLEVRGDEVLSVNASTVGSYTIDNVNLNSRCQVRRRQRRQAAASSIAALHGIISALEKHPRAEEVATELAEARATLLRKSSDLHSPPWDATHKCECPESSQTARSQRPL